MRLYAFIGDMEFIGLADISVSHVGAQLQVQNPVNKSWIELLKGNGSQLKVSGTMIYNNSDAVKTLRDNIELTSGFTSIRLKRSVDDNELYSITGFCKFSDSFPKGGAIVSSFEISSSGLHGRSKKWLDADGCQMLDANSKEIYVRV